jgi:hypothetical protein
LRSDRALRRRSRQAKVRSSAGEVAAGERCDRPDQGGGREGGEDQQVAGRGGAGEGVGTGCHEMARFWTLGGGEQPVP